MYKYGIKTYHAGEFIRKIQWRMNGIEFRHAMLLFGLYQRSIYNYQLYNNIRQKEAFNYQLYNNKSYIIPYIKELYNYLLQEFI